MFEEEGTGVGGGRSTHFDLCSTYSVLTSNMSIARSYLLEYARSHQHSEAKQEWAGIVLS